MGIWRRIRSLFALPKVATLSDRLNGSSEVALAASLRSLRPAQRGWITLEEARSLFSTMEDQYAFGEMDERAKIALTSFAAKPECRSDFQFMPVEGRLYFTRKEA